MNIKSLGTYCNDIEYKNTSTQRGFKSKCKPMGFISEHLSLEEFQFASKTFFGRGGGA